MVQAHKVLLALWKDEQGQDLIEYALIASFVAVAVAAFFPTSLAPNICSIMSKVLSCMQGAP